MYLLVYVVKFNFPNKRQSKLKHYLVEVFRKHFVNFITLVLHGRPSSFRISDNPITFPVSAIWVPCSMAIKSYYWNAGECRVPPSPNLPSIFMGDEEFTYLHNLWSYQEARRSIWAFYDSLSSLYQLFKNTSLKNKILLISAQT